MAARLSSLAVLALSTVLAAAQAEAQRPAPVPAPAATPNSVATPATPGPAPAQTGNGLVQLPANGSEASAITSLRRQVTSGAMFYQGDVDATAGQYDYATDLKEQDETQLNDNSLGSGTAEGYTMPQRQAAEPAPQPSVRPTVRTGRPNPH